MSKIKIITDSASDISYENEKAYNIDVLPFKVAMGDKSYVSRVDFDNEKFYEMMEEYDGLPTTAQITAFEFGELYKKYDEEGYTDIIYVSINSQGSATYNNALMARDNYKEENPESKMNIHIIDGVGYTGAYGYPVVEAAKKVMKGCPVGEIVSYITDWVNNCTIFFATYSLKYAKKSGRIPSAAAFVGEVMGFKPILRIQYNKIVTECKVRGDKAVVPKILDLASEEIIPQTPYCIVYGCDDAVRDEMAAAMTKKMGYPPADFYQIGAAVAVNAGPKVTGVIFKSRKK